ARHAGRKFLTLSYGQQRLALLARALVQHPDWLLLDEFYNGLDAAYRRRIDAVLAAARRRGQSWVATAHRALDLPRGTRRMLELPDGEVHAVRPVQPKDLERLRRRAGEVPRERSQGRRAWRAAGKAGTPVLVRLSGVDLFVDYRAVLRNVDWQLHEGEHWAIYGANGSGKSSLLKLLYGDLSPPSGGRG